MQRRLAARLKSRTSTHKSPHSGLATSHRLIAQVLKFERVQEISQAQPFGSLQKPPTFHGELSTYEPYLRGSGDGKNRREALKLLKTKWLPFIDAFRTFCRESAVGVGLMIGEADLDQ